MINAQTHQFFLEQLAAYSGEDNFHGSVEAAKAAGLPAPIVQGGLLKAKATELAIRVYGDRVFSTFLMSTTFVAPVFMDDQVLFTLAANAEGSSADLPQTARITATKADGSVVLTAIIGFESI